MLMKILTLGKVLFVLFFIFVFDPYQKIQVKSASLGTESFTTAQPAGDVGKTINLEHLSKEDQNLSPIQENNDSDFGFIEVRENEIPEGSEVYVLEEFEEGNQKTNGETLETASNIVFRPLFRYRGKQEALRRNSNGIRRRYFVPKRYYRRVPYYYPNYFSNGYYFY